MASKDQAHITMMPEDRARIARIADGDPERFVVQIGRRRGEVNVSAVCRHALAVAAGDEERTGEEAE